MKSLLQSKDENLLTVDKLPVEVGVDSQPSDSSVSLAEAKSSVVMHDDSSIIMNDDRRTVMNDDRSIVDPVIQTAEKLIDLTLTEEAPDDVKAHKEGDMKNETGAEERGKEEPRPDPIEEEAKKRLHSRKFREYCDHDLSKDLGKSFTTFVRDFPETGIIFRLSVRSETILYKL
jgi:hypothetical protein